MRWGVRGSQTALCPNGSGRTRAARGGVPRLWGAALVPGPRRPRARGANAYTRTHGAPTAAAAAGAVRAPPRARAEAADARRRTG